MSAVARVWWTFFTGFPVQRVLAGIGVALFCVLGVLVPILARSGTPLGVIIGGVALATLVPFLVFPAVFAAGVLFRYLSAPSVHSLLPRFRLKMLSALVLCIGCAAAVPLAGLLIVAPSSAAAASAGLWAVAASLAFPAAFATALVLGLFAASASPRRGLIFVLSGVAAGQLFAHARDLGFAVGREQAVLGAAVVTVLVWLAFGAWYLRVQRVAPVDMSAFSPNGFARLESRAKGPSSEDAGLSARRAVQTWFTGTSPRRLWTDVPGALLSGGLFLAILHYAPSGPHSMFPVAAVSLLMLLPMLFLIVNRMARRSRYLWLRMAGSRGSVFHAVERLSVRQTVAIAVVMLTLAVGVPVADPQVSHVQSFSYFVTAATGGAFAFYAGLAAVRGPQLLWLGVIAVLVAGQSIAVWALLVDPFHTSIYAAVVASQLAAAALMRWAAVRGWRRIDWLRFKPTPSALGAGGRGVQAT